PAELPAEDLHRRPVPSTSCPCPAWFSRRQSPLFRGGEAAVEKSLVPLQQSLLVQPSQQGAPRIQPHAFVFPLLETPPASGGRRKLVGQKSPCRPGLENPQDTLETSSVGGWRAAPPIRPLSRRRQKS